MTSNRPAGSDSGSVSTNTGPRPHTTNGEAQTARTAPTRRSVLATGAALATAAATGCLGGVFGGGSGENESDTATEEPTPSTPEIEGFESGGNQLLVNANPDANITGFRLITPDREDVVDTAYLRDTTQAKIGLLDDGNPIPGGVYNLYIYNGEEVVNEMKVDLRAKPSVENVELVQPDEYMVAQASVTNTGYIPTPVKYVGFPEDVPAPNPVPDNLNDPLLQGKMKRVDDGPDNPLVTKGETGKFQSTNTPFYFKPDREEEVPPEFRYDMDYDGEQISSEFCGGETVDTVLLVIAGGKRFEYPVSVTYDGEVKPIDTLGKTFICSDVSASFQDSNGTANASGATGNESNATSAN